MPLFDLKCALNQPKMVQNTWNFPFFPFFERIPLNKVATAQNIKNRVGNFLETLIRMIHAKFQTSMTMLRRVDAFCVISQKKGFFPL